MNLNKSFKFITCKIIIKYLNIKNNNIKKFTISNAFQSRTHPDEAQVKFRTQIATFIIINIHPHKNLTTEL
jgi:hypothetical protein